MPDQHLDPVVAANYDSRHVDRFDPDELAATVDVLAELAGEGRALEFAIGTGRVALPLTERGIEVHGLELSQPMVDQLRAKPGGDEIPVTMGDMTSTRLDGSFALVYLVFNTIGNVTTQARQVACFRNAAAHLEAGGHFVIEVGVPDPPRQHDTSPYRPFDFTDDHIGVDEYLDGDEQLFYSHHYRPNETERRQVSGLFRYVWPSELDLMAQLADMSLVERWGDWHRAPFSRTSPSHVSVWQLAQ